MSAWDNPEEMLARAQTARGQGDRDLAYQMYARASEVNPQDPHAWQGRADTATNSDEALVSYAYAAALDPDDQPLARTLDASIALRVNDSTKSDVPLLIAIGQELAEVGLAEHAGQFFQRAAELDRSSTDALVWSAGVETDKEKQIEYLNRALATNPRDPRARAGLLAVKPPVAPPPTPVESSRATLSARIAAAEKKNPSGSAAAARNALPAADSAPPRLQKLGESMPAPAAPAPARPTAKPAPASGTPAASGDKLMRMVLMALLALVVILLFAGIFLLLNS